MHVYDVYVLNWACALASSHSWFSIWSGVKLQPEKKFRPERGSNIWSFINSFAFYIIYWFITNSRCDQLLVGLISQLVEHCTSIAEVMGSNPVQACLSCVYNCDDHSCLHIFLRSSNIWSFINLFAHNQYVELAKPKSAAPGSGDSSEPDRVNPG